jgi:hypothetical protein
VRSTPRYDPVRERGVDSGKLNQLLGRCRVEVDEEPLVLVDLFTQSLSFLLVERLGLNPDRPEEDAYSAHCVRSCEAK